MNGSIRVGNLFGIPFYINFSWFIILALMTLSYGDNLGSQFPQLGLGLSLFLGLIAALLLFASVLAHELGHSFVAIKQGIQVKSITLFLFGGLAGLDQEAKTPAGAFWIAIAGPLVSLLLFLGLHFIGSYLLVTGALSALVNLLAYVNLALAIFNLIPGLPLDGGNILKALVWKITGNQYQGTVFASRAGQVLGLIGISLGFLPLFISGGSLNFWTILIGWFLFSNAGVLAKDATLRNKLSGFTAEDALVNQNSVVSQDISLRTFVNDYIIGKPPIQQFLVTNEAGKLVGQISGDDLKPIPTAQWPLTHIEMVMKSVEFDTIIDAKQSLLEVVNLLEQQQLNQVPVVRNGVLVGFIEKASIRRLLDKPLQANPA
ncbi:MAG TPA: site-2 protease family protein [Planktothrix sp. UBA8402]|nr:site-2 protease family protein [Planktothrix sp. UBA8402]